MTLLQGMYRNLSRELLDRLDQSLTRAVLSVENGDARAAMVGITFTVTEDTDLGGVKVDFVHKHTTTVKSSFHPTPSGQGRLIE